MRNTLQPLAALRPAFAANQAYVVTDLLAVLQPKRAAPMRKLARTMGHADSMALIALGRQ